MSFASLWLPCVSATACPGQEEDCDVTLASTDCMLHSAHRRVLAAHSNILSSMLNVLGNDAVVYLGGLSSRDISSVLDLLYLGRVSVATSRVGHLARQLEELQVPGLVVEEEDATQELDSDEKNVDFSICPQVFQEKSAKKDAFCVKSKLKQQVKEYSKSCEPDLTRQTFSAGPEDMHRLKQLWMTQVRVIKREGGEYVFQCKQCGKEWVGGGKRWSAYHHVDFHHLTHFQHKCEDCLQVFSNHCALKRHIKSKPSGNMEQVSSSNKLVAQKMKRLKVEKFTTNKTKQEESMKQYQEEDSIVGGKSEEKRFICLVCGKEFHYQCLLNKHQLSHTKEKKFECKFCKQRFQRSFHCTRHEKSHSGIKKFQCTLCKKMFMRHENLIVHKKNHLKRMGNCPVREAKIKIDIKKQETLEHL